MIKSIGVQWSLGRLRSLLYPNLVGFKNICTKFDVSHD